MHSVLHSSAPKRGRPPGAPNKKKNLGMTTTTLPLRPPSSPHSFREEIDQLRRQLVDWQELTVHLQGQVDYLIEDRERLRRNGQQSEQLVSFPESSGFQEHGVDSLVSPPPDYCVDKHDELENIFDLEYDYSTASYSTAAYYTPQSPVHAEEEVIEEGEAVRPVASPVPPSPEMSTPAPLAVPRPKMPQNNISSILKILRSSH